MKVIVINKTNFAVLQYDNVSSISYASETYTITYGSPAQTVTWPAADVRISIIW